MHRFICFTNAQNLLPSNGINIQINCLKNWFDFIEFILSDRLLDHLIGRGAGAGQRTNLFFHHRQPCGLKSFPRLFNLEKESRF